MNKDVCKLSSFNVLENEKFIYTEFMRKTFIVIFLIFLNGFAVTVSIANAANLFSQHRFSKQAAVMVTDSQGKALYSWNANKALIPASTIKIATGVAAIERFGLNFQFKTDFFVRDNTLWVKGYGDPYLTSEELEIVAQNLIRTFDSRFLSINTVIVDGTHFPLLKVPGRVISQQPYDAPLAAVSANFNTINIRKKGAKVTSAEPQTPITPLAKQLGKKLRNGVHRINLVRTDNSEQYFAELLVAKLQEQGLNNDLEAKTGFTPVDAELVYQHVNSKTMNDAIRSMLFFSNNFIANQLFLQIRAQGQSVGFSASSAYVMKTLQAELGENTNSKIVEGSGLSRQNKLTAQQLIALLVRFRPYKKMMKSYLNDKAYAKSGTLNGVHNLAGYVTKNGKEYYFAFLFNDSVPWKYRNTLLKELYATL